MKRILLTVLPIFALAVGHAQTQERGPYFGIGASYAASIPVVIGDLRPHLQVGGPIAANVELRGTLTSLLVQSTLGLELLYAPKLATENARLYVGGGLMTRFYFYAPDGFYLDAIVGGELYPESGPNSLPLGFFGELRTGPLTLFQGSPYFYLEARAGINFPL